MLVRLAFGSRRGEVVDFLPTEARAMLADGRASLPEIWADAEAQPVLSVPAPAAPVGADRGLPRGRPRRAR